MIESDLVPHRGQSLRELLTELLGVFARETVDDAGPVAALQHEVLQLLQQLLLRDLLANEVEENMTSCMICLSMKE